ncbi:MAG TPA: TetR family transcriptional regulator [Thermomicrobiales bacterium]|jgi:AcrR family transcriptional regulator|nr:TetR family transcriptional regulator [Thermomicrobiales bacterium]
MSDRAVGVEQMRERILTAAAEEFAEFGLAGARVDRIAATAPVNKNSIYRYFPSKDDLFAAVLERDMSRVLIDVPFTPDDLPGFAAGLFDYALDHPHLMRMMAWSGLERPEATRKETPTMQAKFATIATAQANGRLVDDVAPSIIFTLLTAIGTAWTSVNPFWGLIDAEALRDREVLRAVIVRTVERAFEIRDPRG